VIGKQYHLLKERGRFFEHAMAKSVTATIHPASILRLPDSQQRHDGYAAFVADLYRGPPKLAAS
jgi:hypothetical protein